MTWRIQKTDNDHIVVLAISGRLEAELLNELLQTIKQETASHAVVLDLKELHLVDQEAVRFLASCEKQGISLQNCPKYIREWISREA